MVYFICMILFRHHQFVGSEEITNNVSQRYVAVCPIRLVVKFLALVESTKREWKPKKVLSAFVRDIVPPHQHSFFEAHMDKNKRHKALDSIKLLVCRGSYALPFSVSVAILTKFN